MKKTTNPNEHPPFLCIYILRHHLALIDGKDKKVETLRFITSVFHIKPSRKTGAKKYSCFDNFLLFLLIHKMIFLARIVFVAVILINLSASSSAHLTNENRILWHGFSKPDVDRVVCYRHKNYKLE